MHCIRYSIAMSHDEQTPETFLRNYEKAANSRAFSLVEPFLAEDAVFWFSDGSFNGLEEIRMAFEQTWNTIKDERYVLENIRWVHKDARSACCLYNFRSSGVVHGESEVFEGRGTSLLVKEGNRWKIAHEHLSRL